MTNYEFKKRFSSAKAYSKSINNTPSWDVRNLDEDPKITTDFDEYIENYVCGLETLLAYPIEKANNQINCKIVSFKDKHSDLVKNASDSLDFAINKLKLQGYFTIKEFKEIKHSKKPKFSLVIVDESFRFSLDVSIDIIGQKPNIRLNLDGFKRRIKPSAYIPTQLNGFDNIEKGFNDIFEKYYMSSTACSNIASLTSI